MTRTKDLTLMHFEHQVIWSQKGVNNGASCNFVDRMRDSALLFFLGERTIVTNVMLEVGSTHSYRSSAICFLTLQSLARWRLFHPLSFSFTTNTPPVEYVPPIPGKTNISVCELIPIHFSIIVVVVVVIIIIRQRLHLLYTRRWPQLCQHFRWQYLPMHKYFLPRRIAVVVRLYKCLIKFLKINFVHKKSSYLHRKKKYRNFFDANFPNQTLSDVQCKCFLFIFVHSIQQ